MKNYEQNQNVTLEHEICAMELRNALNQTTRKNQQRGLKTTIHGDSGKSYEIRYSFRESHLYCTCPDCKWKALVHVKSNPLFKNYLCKHLQRVVLNVHTWTEY